MKKIIISTFSVVLPAVALLIFVHPELSQVSANVVTSNPWGVVTSNPYGVVTSGGGVITSNPTGGVVTSGGAITTSGPSNFQTSNPYGVTTSQQGMLTTSNPYGVVTSNQSEVTTSNPYSGTPQSSYTPTSNPAPGLYYVYVAPDDYYKIPGSTVAFTGNHFYPYETVTVTLNGNMIGTIAADKSGNFSTGLFTVPTTTGTAVYTFTGNTSNVPFAVKITIGTSKPWLTLSTYYAGGGAPLTITGHGFGSNEPITVRFAGMVVGNVRASSNGDFSLQTRVPYVGQGTQIIEARGSYSGADVEANFSQAY